MRCARRSRGLPDTEARASPKSSIFLQWIVGAMFYAGEREVRPPGAPATIDPERAAPTLAGGVCWA
jgi:hypothetical protein